MRDLGKKETHAVAAHVRTCIKFREIELELTAIIVNKPLSECAVDIMVASASPALLREVLKIQGSRFLVVEMICWCSMQSLPLDCKDGGYSHKGLGCAAECYHKDYFRSIYFLPHHWLKQY